jgi:hypothetical protein
MLKGIYRSLGPPPSAWVAEGPDLSGERLSEVDYRARGYLPEFDLLPVRIVQRVPVSSHETPEADRSFIEESLKYSQRS